MPDTAPPARWPALFTTATFAEYTGLSTRTVEKLAAMNLPNFPKTVKLPGELRCTRWRREDVDAFLADLPVEAK